MHLVLISFSPVFGPGGWEQDLWPIIFKVHTEEQADMLLSFQSTFAELCDESEFSADKFCFKFIPGRGKANGRTDALDKRVGRHGELGGYYCVYYGLRAAIYLDQ